jgi:hypothetical protein
VGVIGVDHIDRVGLKVIQHTNTLSAPAAVERNWKIESQVPMSCAG